MGVEQTNNEETSLARVRALAQFWNWLPAFRAVAESEHLPTAARELGVSAPGLSRTVKQLEAALGHSLFERQARRIILSDAGRLFLARVREAMRRIDDGVQTLNRATYEGTIRISASNSVGYTYVVPALDLLAESHPRLMPELMMLDEAAACTALRKGAIDLALIEQADVPGDLSVSWLESFTYSVYCSSSHPLARLKNPTLESCLQYAFVAPPHGVSDGWPKNLRRRIELRVSGLNIATRVCSRGRLIAALPDQYVRNAGWQLHRVDVAPLSEEPIFVAHRESLGSSDRVAVLVAALRRVAEAIQ